MWTLTLPIAAAYVLNGITQHVPSPASSYGRMALNEQPRPIAEDVPMADIPSTDAYATEDLIEENVLNEEMTVTVSYIGGAKGRTRRVRRTRRPPIEERWAQETAEALEQPGYQRMSAFCNFGALNLESAAELLALDDRFREFGDRLSVVSYADVLHCRFTSAVGAYERDAFLFPYGSLLLWGLSNEQELRFLELVEPCSEPIDSHGVTSASAELADFEFMCHHRRDQTTVRLGMHVVTAELRAFEVTWSLSAEAPAHTRASAPVVRSSCASTCRLHPAAGSSVLRGRRTARSPTGGMKRRTARSH